MAINLPTQATKPSSSCTAAQDQNGFLARRIRNRSITARERIFFTEQLSLLLETGTSLHTALQTIEGQAENPTLAKVISGLRREITSGKSFSYALAQYPGVFPLTYVKLVEASEGGGFTSEVLDELVAMGEARDKLQRSLLSAFSYPAFLLAFSVSVVIFILIVVFPKFAEMFTAIRDQLPVTTQVLMTASNHLHDHWLALLSILGIAFLGLRFWLGTESGRAAIDGLTMTVPVLRDIVIRLYLTQSLRVLSLSLSHGVPVVDALCACRDVVRNGLFRSLLLDVERTVQEGSGIAVGFQRSPHIPSLAQQMIATGEETGNLPKAMARIADFYEMELTRRLQTFSRLAEPVMLLVMGAVVGVVVSSLILPIFKLSRAVS